MNDIKSILLRDEGLSLKPYKCTKGHWTIGVGHNMDADPLPDEMQLYLDTNGSITEEMAFRLFDEDMTRATIRAESFQWFHLLSDARQVVVICMIFQMGLTNFKKFKRMIAALNQGDYLAAASEMLDSDWAIETPDRVKSLVKIMKEG